MNFEEIYQIVEESSHETAFNKEECEALFSLASEVPDSGVVVEIGVEYGRSTSLIAEVQKTNPFTFIAIDPHDIQENGAEARAHVLSQMEKHSWNFDLWQSTSEQAETRFKLNYPITQVIDLLHIDGNHDYEFVLQDCRFWMPKVKQGGYACFDDYGHDSLPGVYQACQEYIKKDEWKFIGRYGNKLGVFKRR